MIHRLCIFGVGLIGGSLAKALRSASAVDSIIGCGRTEANLVSAVELNVIDEYTLDPVMAVSGADMIVVAATLGATRSIFEQITEHIAPTTIVTDVGSAKARVVEAARACLGGNFSQFVPGHPIAGTEKSGVDAAFVNLGFNKKPGGSSSASSASGLEPEDDAEVDCAFASLTAEILNKIPVVDKGVAGNKKPMNVNEASEKEGPRALEKTDGKLKNRPTY